MSFALLLAKNVHLSIGEEFCAFPCQKFCTSVSHLSKCAEFTLSIAKNVHFSKQFVFFALSNGVIDRGSKQQSPRSNFRLHRSSFSTKKSKKWIKLIPKTIGNRKRDCARGCAWGINTTWENLQIEEHKSGGRSFRSPNWFVLFDLQISQVVFLPQAQPHAQSLFLLPIVFGINIYHSLTRKITLLKWGAENQKQTTTIGVRKEKITLSPQRLSNGTCTSYLL